MQIKTREECQSAFQAVTANAFESYDTYPEFGLAQLETAIHDGLEEILNELFPKPESDRLKLLRQAKKNHIANGVRGGHHDAWRITSEVIDQAIKEEEAKS